VVAVAGRIDPARPPWVIGSCGGLGTDGDGFGRFRSPRSKFVIDPFRKSLLLESCPRRSSKRTFCGCERTAVDDTQRRNGAEQPPANDAKRCRNKSLMTMRSRRARFIARSSASATTGASTRKSGSASSFVAFSHCPSRHATNEAIDGRPKARVVVSGKKPYPQSGESASAIAEKR